MKKFLIGCCVVAVLLFVIASGVVIYTAVKLNRFVKNLNQNVESVVTLEKDFPFAAPESGEMDPARFNKYLAIRQAISARAMEIEFLRENVAAIEEDRESQVDAGDIFGLFASLPGLVEVVSTRMREAQMSPSEYAFFSRSSARAIAWLGGEGDEEFKDLIQRLDGVKLSMQATAQPIGSPGGTQATFDLDKLLGRGEPGAPPEINLRLVDEHREEFLGNVRATVVEIIIITLLDQNLQERGIAILDEAGGEEEQPIGGMDLVPEPAE